MVDEVLLECCVGALGGSGGCEGFDVDGDGRQHVLDVDFLGAAVAAVAGTVAVGQFVDCSFHAGAGCVEVCPCRIMLVLAVRGLEFMEVLRQEVERAPLA